MWQKFCHAAVAFWHKSCQRMMEMPCFTRFVACGIFYFNFATFMFLINNRMFIFNKNIGWFIHFFMRIQQRAFCDWKCLAGKTDIFGIHSGRKMPNLRVKDMPEMYHDSRLEELMFVQFLAFSWSFPVFVPKKMPHGRLCGIVKSMYLWGFRQFTEKESGRSGRTKKIFATPVIPCFTGLGWSCGKGGSIFYIKV